MSNFDYQEVVSELWKELEAKRDFGLKKYGSISFQSSLENLEKCDTLKHLEEELVDAINYSLASLIKIRLVREKLTDV